MKHLKILLYLLISIACLWSCKYDDEDLWNKINSLEERIASLEEMLSNMNKDISSISTIVNALQDNITVTNIEQKENSYTITFSNDKKVTITNGKDGEDGKDAPIIGIDIFEGSYFWTQTIQGVKTWLTDSNGDKIPVTGEGGITPRLKVSASGYWMVSYDNGISYTQIVDDKGKPVLAVGKDGTDGEDGKDGIDGSDGEDGKDGDSFFKEVKVEGNELVLILKDGTTLRIPYSNGGDTNIQTATIKGSVELESTEDISVLSLVGESKLSQEQFSVDVISNNLPQLLFVTDETDNVIMMARGYFQEKSAEINVQSTALALVSVMPQLVVKTKDDFDELSQMILQSTHFNKVKEEVEKCIKAKKDILDTNNTDLFQNIETLINDLMGKNQTRAFEHIAGIETSPLDVKAQGNTVSIRNIDLYPTYECKVTYGGKQFKNELINTPGSFGILDVIKGESGINHYGDPTKFSLIHQGEYNFYCDKTTQEARSHLGYTMASDILSVIGIEDEFIGDLADTYTTLASTIANLYTGAASIEDLASFAVELIIQEIERIAVIIKGEAAENIFKILGYFDTAEGLSIIVIRATEALKAPSPITFNLCYYSEITCCTNVTLTKVEKSDNQTGEPEKQLENPIEVLVTSIAEDGTPILNDYHKVKFEVISGNGSVANLIADINENGFAKTTWILGESGIQQVRAVVINSITNTEVSEPVIFTAKIKGIIVETGSATNITATSATLSGTVLTSDDEESDSYGICYSTHNDPTDVDRNIVEATSNQDGTFSVTLSSLTTGTTYYWCAYAYYNGTYVWGKVKSFTPVGSDRDILVALYEATGGENWVNKTNWCTDRPLNEWYGIEATADGKVTDIDLRNNGLTGAMDLKGLLALEGFVCDKNQVTSIDLSGCYNLRNVSCYNNPNLTSVDVSNCLLLYEVWCNDNESLTQLNVSGCISMESINCYNNQITSLDVSDLKNLRGLICAQNQIQALNLSGLSNLKSVNLNDNRLTTLNVSGLKNLISIACDNNALYSLNVSQCSTLEQISCENNQITSLDLSGLISLQKIRCTNNKIDVLDIFDATNISQLYCKENQITQLRISKTPNILEIDYWGDKDSNLYPEPNHKEGYQYPEFIYQ